MERDYMYMQDLSVDDIIHARKHADDEVLIFEEPFTLHDHFCIPLRFSYGKKRRWEPNEATLKRLKEAFGDDPKQWKGKLLNMQVPDDPINGYPLKRDK
jgi:hypothetical protein